jgi:hypothetical protein
MVFGTGSNSACDFQSLCYSMCKRNAINLLFVEWRSTDIGLLSLEKNVLRLDAKKLHPVCRNVDVYMKRVNA